MTHIGHVAPISSVASWKSKVIATAGYDNKVVVWDTEFNLMGKVAHDHLVNFVDISPCGTLLASCSSDYSIRIWSIYDFNEIARFDLHLDDVEMVKFSPSSALIVACSRDKTISIFNITTKSLVGHFKGHLADVLSVEWIDEQNIVSCGDDSSVRFWNVTTGLQTKELSFNNIETDTLTVISESLLVVGNDNGELHLLENGESIYCIKAHQSGVKRVTYNKDNKQLISISYDRKVSLWRIVENEILNLNNFEIPPYVWPRSCCFINNELIAFGTFTSHYAYFNLNKNEWICGSQVWSRSLNSLFASNGNIYSIGDSGTLFCNGEKLISVESLCNFVVADDHFVYFGGQEGVVWSYQLKNKKLAILFKNESPINCSVIFNRNVLCVGDYNGCLSLISLIDNSVRVFKIFDHAIKSICLNGNEIFSVSADCKAAFFDLKHEIITNQGNCHDKIANDCVSDGTNFYSVSRDLILRRFSNGSIEKIKTPHKNSIKTVSVNRDGSLIATGSYSGEVVFYAFENGITNVHSVIRPTNHGISKIIFNHDRNQFVASSYDGNVYKFNFDGE